MIEILVLEDAPERIKAFMAAGMQIQEAQLVFRNNDPGMIAYLKQHQDQVGLISLDYDLVPYSNMPTPGTGLDVCKFLATITPACPVIVHTANADAVWPMLEELCKGGWERDWLRHGPIGELWIGQQWLPRVRYYLDRDGKNHPPHADTRQGPTKPPSTPTE